MFCVITSVFKSPFSLVIFCCPTLKKWLIEDEEPKYFLLLVECIKKFEQVQKLFIRYLELFHTLKNMYIF